jgi:hypothetical protein
MGNAVVEEQIITLAQPPEHLLDLLVPGYLLLPTILLEVVNHCLVVY